MSQNPLSAPATQADVQALQEKLDLIFYAQAEILTRATQTAEESLHYPLYQGDARRMAVLKTMARLKDDFQDQAEDLDQ